MLFGGAKYKPETYRKWQTKQPKATRLLQLWPTMNQEEREAVARLAASAGWLPVYLGELPDAAAGEALLTLMPSLPGEHKQDNEANEQERLLHRLIDKLADPKEQGREAAGDLLIRLGDERMITPLIVAALKDDTYDAALVSRVLGAFLEKSGRILAMVYSGVGPGEKRRILQVLGYLKPAESLELLERAICEPDVELRITAARVCGQVLPENLVKFLYPLVHDPEDKVRTAACETLGKFGGTAAVPVLQAAFDRDEAWTVKSMCASFLSKWQEELAAQIRADEEENSLIEKIN